VCPVEQRHLPLGFEGTLTRDYGTAFVARVVADLRAALGRARALQGAA
jgi:hypothetical protein